jgi:hypothetical protein
MRLFGAATVLLGGALLFYASAGTSAQGQATQAAIVTGEKLVLYPDIDRAGQHCTVIDVRGDFLGCAPNTDNIGRTNYDRWYNLRLIARIDRPTKAQ